ncbi:nucleotide pyrophosphohydrolase [Exilibacterium tricleocarpae]|uniref:Nucleotide pyrophosphohydrolase n=1 Tax=Exilibacterium tricleocarpae TaxID=2591008 RepID=A0A545SXI1_9GAMM|nr:MazG-like family protein [Exilibacterium tricleocarpae]TQV69668.1 nucleotide pyrophosphohydrolase [Exilibacterium tricleocarpae]
MDLDKVLDQYNKLCEDNDWQVFRTPKNLSSALCVASANILSHYQWVTEEESLSLGLIPERKAEIADKISDTFFLLLALANKTGIDLEQAVLQKAEKNEQLHTAMPDNLE